MKYIHLYDNFGVIIMEFEYRSDDEELNLLMSFIFQPKKSLPSIYRKEPQYLQFNQYHSVFIHFLQLFLPLMVVWKLGL